MELCQLFRVRTGSPHAPHSAAPCDAELRRKRGRPNSTRTPVRPTQALRQRQVRDEVMSGGSHPQVLRCLQLRRQALRKRSLVERPLADPVGQRRAVHVKSRAGENLRLTVQRKMVGILPHPPCATLHGTSAFNREHGRILAALAALWTSGAVLAWVATGGEPSAPSSKLAAKAVTAAALAMGRYALPTIAAHTGVPLLALGLATKLRLATLGALSGAGWASALLIGASESLASAPAPVLAGVVATTHSGALALAWALALTTHGPGRRGKAAHLVAPETVSPVYRLGALPRIARR